MKALIPPVVFLFISGVFFAGCVSQSKYQQALDENGSLKTQVGRIDSLQQINGKLEQEVQDVNGYYQGTLHQLEQLKGTNQGLFATYQDLQTKYDRLISQQQNFGNTASYEKQNLTAQLTAFQQELDKKEQYLRNLEWELAEKEERLNRMQQEDVRQDLVDAEQTIRQLRAQLQQKDAVIQQIKNNITQLMYGFSQSDFSITEKRGKLYITMSQNLLFPSGSSKIDKKGQDALRQLAGALKNNPNIDIMVEGHTDTDGSATQNWNLSVLRATAVTQLLIDYGVDSQRLTAAGRAFYDPVATNSTNAGKALNRRTEIVVSPKLDELMDLVNTPK